MAIVIALAFILPTCALLVWWGMYGPGLALVAAILVLGVPLLVAVEGLDQ